MTPRRRDRSAFRSVGLRRLPAWQRRGRPIVVAARSRPSSSPSGPTTADLDRALKQIARLSPAGVRRRGPRRCRPRSARSPPATPSCCRPATAPRASRTFSADNIREKLRVILQMAVVLTYSLGVPVVKVGRIAGQFAKPRSSPTSSGSATSSCPSFRGHIVNDAAPTAGGPRARPRAARAGVPPVGVDAEPAAGLHQGRLRRPRPGPRLDAGVRRRPAPRVSATSSSPPRSTGRCASCGPAASTPRPTTACTRSTSTPATRR